MLCRNCSYKSMWGETRDRALHRTIILIGIQTLILFLMLGISFVHGIENGPNLWVLIPGSFVCVAIFFGNVYFDLRRADKHLAAKRGGLDDPPSISSYTTDEVTTVQRENPIKLAKNKRTPAYLVYRRKRIANGSALTRAQKQELLETLTRALNRIYGHSDRAESAIKALRSYVDRLPGDRDRERFHRELNSLIILLENFESDTEFMLHHATDPVTRVWLDTIGG